MYFFKNLLFYSVAWFRQTKCIVMMTKEGSSKIVNFMTPGAGVLMLGRSHISHYSEYVLSSTLSIYSTLIAIVLRDYDAAFLYHRDFHISMMGLLIHKYEPLWQEVNVKSLILRCPLRPVGLLLIFYTIIMIYSTLQYKYQLCYFFQL